MKGEEIRISEFNELQFKMIRIHKLQDQINELWLNPLQPSLAFGDYNYKLLISILENLYSEVHPKCDEKEQEKVKGIFDSINELAENEPPFEKQHPMAKNVTLDRKKWLTLKVKLKELNLYIRTLLDNHGFSPDKDLDLMGL